jgi:hypothetical protein
MELLGERSPFEGFCGCLSMECHRLRWTSVNRMAPQVLYGVPESTLGQFSIDGTVTSNGTTLNFLPGTIKDWYRHTTRYLQASRSR